MANLGYLRVSTLLQDVDNQKLALLEFARRERMQVDDFIEVTVSSRKSFKLRRLDEVLAKLQETDTLIVAELSRLGRSVGEVVSLVAELVRRKINLITIKENIRLSGHQDIQTKVMITVISLLAELERDLLSARTKEGLIAARARGKTLGRPRGSLGTSKLTGQELAIQGLLDKHVSIASIAKIHSVDRATVYSFIASRGLVRRRWTHADGVALAVPSAPAAPTG